MMLSALQYYISSPAEHRPYKIVVRQLLVGDNLDFGKRRILNERQSLVGDGFSRRGFCMGDNIFASILVRNLRVCFPLVYSYSVPRYC